MEAQKVIYQGKKHSTQNAVRQVLENLKEASVRQIREILGLTDDKGRDRVYRALESLKKSGWAEGIKHKRGVYRYTVPSEKSPVLQQKIWRAIRISQRFTVDEIILLSGASGNYVRKYLKWLTEQGYLVCLGVKKNKRIYQKTDKVGRQTPIYTQMKKGKKTEEWEKLEQATWALVRLVLKADHRKKKEIKQAVEELSRITG